MKLTPEIIKSAAISITENYLNNKTSLTTGVVAFVKQAELNPEQTKRVVEATNQLAYLKQLQNATDRTFEFPVADYNSVMSELSMLDKQASVIMDKPSPLSIVSASLQGLEKKASEMVYNDRELTLALFKKELIKQAQQVDLLVNQKEEMLQKLASAAEKVSKDTEFLDKLAMAASQEDFLMLSAFATGMDKQASDSEFKNLYREKDLAEVKEFVGLFKQAKELITKTDTVVASLEKAAAFVEASTDFSDIEKQAFVGLIAQGIGTLGRGAAKAAWGVTRGLASGMGLRSAGKSPTGGVMAPVNYLRKKRGLTEITKGTAAMAVGQSTLDSTIRKPNASVWDSIHRN